uniref:Uncharacterized protein n=1 Tax=Romanomermis culicivorax TaxID=13658 RepID=A0A915K1Z7_ROMCU
SLADGDLRNYDVLYLSKWSILNQVLSRREIAEKVLGDGWAGINSQYFRAGRIKNSYTLNLWNEGNVDLDYELLPLIPYENHKKGRKNLLKHSNHVLVKMTDHEKMVWNEINKFIRDLAKQRSAKIFILNSSNSISSRVISSLKARFCCDFHTLS